MDRTTEVGGVNMNNKDSYVGIIRTAITKMCLTENIDELNIATTKVIENIKKLQSMKTEQIIDKKEENK